MKYWATPFGSADRCGNIEPGTAATAKSNKSKRAVRIEVNWRQVQRDHPAKDISGEVISPSKRELEITKHLQLNPRGKGVPNTKYKQQAKNHQDNSAGNVESANVLFNKTN